jgi:Uma2 family endonuclease
MAQSITIPRTLPSGEIVALDVSEADYMAHYAESHHEWIEGIVVRMSPIALRHTQIVDYLRQLFQAYFALRRVGRVLGEPFVMRLEGSRREPDLLVILGDSLTRLTNTYLDGPADICIEVVSPGSEAVDYGDKLAEYERGRVREYWIIDPARHAGLFYRLTATDQFELVTTGTDGNYVTPLIPDFRLHVPTLWTDELPDYGTVWTMIQAMVNEK